jgi:hypothetical protein
VRVAVVAFWLAACGPSGAALAPKTTAAPPGEPLGGAPAANRSPGTGSVLIQPYAPTAPTISFSKPRADESVPLDAARTQPVVLDDGGFLDENPGSRITLVLDGDVVRDLQDVRAPLTLGSLDIAGRALDPGEHVLAAVVAGPRGEAARFGPTRRVASTVRRFFVGAPAQAPGSAPMLIFLVPRGTYNGPSRTNAALLDFVTVGGDVGVDGLSLRVRITGPRGASDAVLTGPGPYSLRGLESGDHRIDLELQKPDQSLSGRWARTSRTITVNLDGPAR